MIKKKKVTSKVKRYTGEEGMIKIIENYGYEIINLHRNNFSGTIAIKDKNGYKYDTYIQSLLNGNTPHIVDKRNSYSLENIIIWLKLNNKNFILDKENKYLNAHTKLRLFCLICKNIFYLDWNHIHSQNNKCPYCTGQLVSDRNRLSIKFPEIAKDWHPTKNGKLTAKDVSFGSITRRWWLCQYGHEYFVSPNQRTNTGSGCPTCLLSSGERLIVSLLKLNKIEYIKEYKISECRYKNVLPFDFYLPDYNLCIEYNGEQHYKPVDFSGKNIKRAKKNYKLLVIKDKIKKNYCKNNKIKLLIIPYWKYSNIEKILKKHLL